MKELEGIRVLEIASIGPGPLAANTFFELGAEVIRINKPFSEDVILPNIDPSIKKRINITVDLKNSDGIKLLKKILKRTDILLEGNRPEVMEKIGLGPNEVHKINPQIVYIRITGWGQNGKVQNTAGHDINYLALSGILSLLGRDKEPPTPPLNLLADYGSGAMFAVIAGLLGIHEVKNNNKKDITYDVSMLEGASYLGSLIFGLKDAGIWNKKRGSNIIDGGAPFYRCYETKDNKYIAVGALENKFYSQLIYILNCPKEMIEQQMDHTHWKQHTEILTEIFLTRTRDEWANIFIDTDCCVTPVLDLDEAREHPHAVSRESFYNNFPRSNNFLNEKNQYNNKASINTIFNDLEISEKFLSKIKKNGTLSIE